MGRITFYSLCYPNREVRHSLTDGILNLLTKLITPKENTKLALFESLEQGNISNLKTIFHSFKNYYEKYITASTYDKYSLHRRDRFEKVDNEIYLVGVEFSKLERNITNFEWEKLVP
jgi:hypothetical protein